jgi:hypothetical protein
MSGVRRDPSEMPMSMGSDSEWLPTLGELWQLVHVPGMAGMFSASFRPFTPVMAIGLELKSA